MSGAKRMKLSAGCCWSTVFGHIQNCPKDALEKLQRENFSAFVALTRVSQKRLLEEILEKEHVDKVLEEIATQCTK